MSEERVSYATGIPRLQPRGGSQSTRTVSGFIAELKYVIHGLTRRHRINYKAWMKAGKPNLGWKPVA